MSAVVLYGLRLWLTFPVCRLDGLKIMMEFPKPKDEDEQIAESITERKQVLHC